MCKACLMLGVEPTTIHQVIRIAIHYEHEDATRLLLKHWKDHLTPCSFLQRAAIIGNIGMVKLILRSDVPIPTVMPNRTLRTLVWNLIFNTSLWLSDENAIDSVQGNLQCLQFVDRMDIRRESVWTRQTRDLLRPLVDPRAKAIRSKRFQGSPLLRLPWHIRVEVLRYVVFRPIHPGWGRLEFAN